MLVCLQAIRRATNAETSVIHVVMPPVAVFMYTHLGVASDDSSSHRCRDLSDSPRHASSVFVTRGLSPRVEALRARAVSYGGLQLARGKGQGPK